MTGPTEILKQSLWTRQGEGGPAGAVARAPLYLLSLLYGAVVRKRTGDYLSGVKPRARVNARVIVVGNLTVGGSGKTQVAAWLAARLLERGARPAVLLRGYKGKAGKGPMWVSRGEGPLCPAWESGDEAAMLARSLRGVAVIAGSERALSARAAVDEFHATHLVLDDGFQHFALARDLDLLVVDAGRDPAREYLLPRGPLREPVSAAARAHALIFAKAESAKIPDWEWIEKICPGKPCFAMKSRPLGIFDLQGGKLGADEPSLAFCGIGKPEGFFRDLESFGARVVAKETFSDHYQYRPQDVSRLCALAGRAGAKRLVTTEKDAVKIGPAWPGKLPLTVFRVEPDFMGAEGRLISLALGPDRMEK